MDAGRGDSTSPAHVTDASATQQATTPAATTAELARLASSQPLTHDRDSDSDASSDMDVSESDDEQEPAAELQRPEPHADGAQGAGAKRKMSDVVTNGSHAVHELAKKPRLSPPPPSSAPDSQPTPAPLQKTDSSKPAEQHLPVEIWQHVFLYLPPAILGRCLSVSRTFNTYLTDVHVDGDRDGKKEKQNGRAATVKKTDSNKIWANARRLWFPNLLKPLPGYTELQMLQLIGGLFCQFCHQKPVRSVAATSAFDAGPGPDGLRVIWPFAIRTCGSCLQANTMNDIALLQSPAATLAPGLSYAFMTKDQNYIPEMQRQAPGGMSAQSGASIFKVYYRQDIDAIVAEHKHAAELGAAEEWRKGLFGKRKEAMNEAAKWEKWEGQMRPGSDLVQALREYDLSSFPHLLAEAKRRSAASQHHQPANITNGTSPSHALPPAPHFSQPVHSAPAFQQAAYHATPYPVAAQGWPSQQYPKPAKEPQDVQERRQARKEDIERRCLSLDPPLDPSVLPNIESFRAAMQIARPMTDQEWAALEPRILAQREEAELAAHLRAEQLAALQATMPSYTDDTFLKPAKEIYDKGYDLAQEPLRRKLVEYVDEHVNASWNGNPNLDRDTGPVFAAKTILHVHQRYKEDEAAGMIPKDDALSSTSRTGGSPPQDPFLSLDNMKWLFENKVRSYLDASYREIFLCADCLEEVPKTVKWFAFEGLIQHYGAKHTNEFSRGNITVYWQTAAWPADPPFHPKPEEYIRPSNRKSAGYRGRGNAKHTPQPRRDAMFNTPVSIQHENAYAAHPQGPHTNGLYGGAQGYPSHSYGQSNHHAGPYGQFQSDTQAPLYADDEPDALDGTKANKLGADAREIWDALEGVSGKEMLNCVRVQTVLHHASSRFLDAFRKVPTLDNLTDALATNPAMQPIKVAAGLACKQCVANQTDGSASYQSYYSRIKNVKLHNVNGLVNHFKIMHLPHMPYAIWMKDMIELPEEQLVRDLPHAQGMDDAKLKLIVDTFPAAQPDPLAAMVEGLPGVPPVARAVSGAGVASKLMEGLSKRGKGQGQGKKKGKRGDVGTPAAREGSQEVPLPAPQEHEYDPRKPMSSKEQDDEDDAARFDTDIARKKAPAGAGPPAASAFGLAPETLRALQALGVSQNLAPAGSVQHTPMAETKMERAPSVGRDDYPAAQAPSAAPAPPPSSSNANVQPDIAAILASLTGGAPAPQPHAPPQQVTTPTAHDRGSRDASMSRSGPRSDAGVDQLYRSLSTAHGHGRDRPSSSAYPTYAAPPPPRQEPQASPLQLNYRTSVEPSTPSPRYEPPGQDLQAALQRNARHFSQNQAPPPAPPPMQTYAPSSAYAPASPPQQHIAPPRYHQYVQQHDDGYGPGHGPGYAQAPAQGQPAPVQYLPRPQPGYAPPPQQRTVYVDEHGREIQLIPVEQYAPQPQPQYGGYGHYEQQPPGQQGWYGAGR